jgi:hypothetical protein
MLSKSGIHFESKDFIFDLPMTEIKKVEVQGTRKDFSTFAIQSKSSLIAQQESLLLRREDAYKQPEAVLVVSLDNKEDLSKSLTTLKQYQAVVQAAKDEEARELVGAVGPEQRNYPFIGKTIRVFVIDHRDFRNPPLHGYLTFFEDRVQFASDETTFSIPIGIIQKVECAGARETFLALSINQKSEFFRLYQAYLRHHFSEPLPIAEFQLDAEEDVRQSFTTATQFQKYMGDVLAGRVNAMTSAAPIAEARQLAQPQQIEQRELSRYNVALIEKFSPNATINRFKVITGVRGKLVVFNSGIEYVSDEPNPNVKVSRRQYFENGRLRFSIPAAAIVSVADASVIRDRANASVNSFIAEIDLDRGSEFFRSHGALMAESSSDNVLFLLFASRWELEQYLSTWRLHSVEQSKE